MALKPGQKDTFAEHRQATATSHVPMRQIGGPSKAYSKGYAKINWGSPTLQALAKSLKQKDAKKHRGN